MNIIAHRGYWREEFEKNSITALRRALEEGYGFESDFRDYDGRLVISHNIADENCHDAEEIFRYYKEIGCNSQLAINVKADGIQNLLERLISKYNICNYFLFDMSIPELIVNSDRGLRFYTRHSDVEEYCVMYDKADGVWLDSFYDDSWLTLEIIEKHVQKGKPVCIVSPELHQKDYTIAWNLLKNNNFHKSELMSLCTDIPDKAKEFFGL